MIRHGEACSKSPVYVLNIGLIIYLTPVFQNSDVLPTSRSKSFEITEMGSWDRMAKAKGTRLMMSLKLNMRVSVVKQ